MVSDKDLTPAQIREKAKQELQQILQEKADKAKANREREENRGNRQ